MPFDSDPLEPANRDLTTIAKFKSEIAGITPLSGSAHYALYGLLQGCSWQLLLIDGMAELVIHCPNHATRAQIVSHLLDLAILLDRLHGSAKIQVLGSVYPLTTTTDRVMGYYRVAQYSGHHDSDKG